MKAYRSAAYLFLSPSLPFVTFPIFFFSATRSAGALALFTVTVDSVQEAGRLVLRGVLNDGRRAVASVQHEPNTSAKRREPGGERLGIVGGRVTGDIKEQMRRK